MIKWFRQFENALRAGIPALRRMGIVMEIAAYPHKPGPFGEREVAAHGWYPSGQRRLGATDLRH